MDVSFSDDQELLRKSAREFLADQCPTALVREVMDGGPSTSGAQDLWKKMAELGWMGLAFDESLGGVGLGLVDLAILAEEMGRALVPVPWFSTVALAGEAIRVAGSDDQRSKWLPKIASGEVRATLALVGTDGRLGPRYLTTKAESKNGSFVLLGTTSLVPDLVSADLVVVAAELGGKAALFAVETGASGVTKTEEPTLDMTRRLGTLQLDQVEVGADSLLGGEACGWDTIERSIDRAATILCAEMCGGSQRVLDLAVEYAKNRVQFGRAIGSFQGVSHRCADMLLQIEGARSLTYYAAWCCDEEPGQAAIAASSAKASAGDTYRSCTAQAIQIHGGVGFTWEVDLHLWYRRAFWDGSMLGDSIYHRERVAALLDL